MLWITYEALLMLGGLVCKESVDNVSVIEAGMHENSWDEFPGHRQGRVVNVYWRRSVGKCGLGEGWPRAALLGESDFRLREINCRVILIFEDRALGPI